MDEQAEPMDVEQADCGAYYQVPLLYLLRNACAPALSTVLVQDFKKIGFHRENNARKAPVVCSSAPSNQAPQYIDLEKLNLFEFLKKINSIGKKKRDKQSVVEREKEKEPFRDFQLNNLKETESDLTLFKASDMLDSSKAKVLIDTFRKYDVTFLLNFLTNYVLDYELDDALFNAISEVKLIRNAVFHLGRKVVCADFQEKHDKLNSALDVFYKYLNWDSSELHEKIEMGKNQHWMRLKDIAPQILNHMYEELAAEEMANVDPGYLERYIMPSVVDTRKNMGVIENFEQFLQQNDDPVVLTAPSGFGKSTMLKYLTQKFYCNKNMQYKLVIYLDSSDRIIESCDISDFYDASSKKIFNSCPRTIEKFGIEQSLCILEMVDDILFVVNWNVRVIESKRRSEFRGKWIICSHNWSPEWPQNCHVVRIMPLNETLVKKMLKSLLPDNSSYQEVVRLYDECEYKGLINSPDMVSIFSEIRKKTRVDQLLQCFLRKKCANIDNPDNQYKALEKKAFEAIKDNHKYYLDNDLCGISCELKISLFLERDKTSRQEHKTFVHRYRIIEDLLAAEYIADNPEVTKKIRIQHVPFFKRVFRFVYAKWCEDGKVQENLSYIKEFLTEYMHIDVKSQTKKNNKKKKKEKEKMGSDILDTNTEFSMADSFSKWSYLISIAEYSKFQRDIMQLICGLLSEKCVWVFKCKTIDVDKIEALAIMLENVKLTRKIIINIESGPQISTLSKIWFMLSQLPGLYNCATIQIIIMHKQSLQVCESDLHYLPNEIAKLDKPLFITKYAGPIICDQVEHFLRCHCMQKLEVMDVSVYDVTTLSQVLSCEALSRLKVMVIKIDLRLGKTALQSSETLRLPVLSEKITFKLSIKYFDGLQNLLEKFENKCQLENLSIRSVRLDSDFKSDLSTFTKLKCVFIHFNRHSAQNSMKESVTDLDFGQPMALDGSETNTRGSSVTLQLLQNLKLPNNLERLLFRNAGFCCDSNTYIIQRYRGNNIQRLTLLDSNLSIKGVRDVLRSHAVENDRVLEQRLKRHCISRNESTVIRNFVKKNPRLHEDERIKRRMYKPPGKELIITSQINMCDKCKQFPCMCKQTDELIHRDSLEDVIHLIEESYQYDILSLSYYSEIITVRKDVCGDLRVHCPLTGVDDAKMRNLEEGDECLRAFFYSLTRAQCITLNFTDLSVDGCKLVIEKLKDLKKKHCTVLEPFSLSIFSHCHLNPDEIRNSNFLTFLKGETCLKQFKFGGCTDKFYITKSLKAAIYMNDELIKLRN